MPTGHTLAPGMALSTLLELTTDVSLHVQNYLSSKDGKGENDLE